MGSGVKSDAFKNYGIGQNLANQYSTNAANVYGSLEPQLAAEAAHPAGFTPTQKANMNTAAQQSAGGSNAAAIGQGRLYAQRTRNAGGAKAAIGNAVRGAGENLSNAAVGTEMANAQLQQHQRQQALSGLNQLNSAEMGSGLNALGLSTQALNPAAEMDQSRMKLLGQLIQPSEEGAKYLMEG